MDQKRPQSLPTGTLPPGLINLSTILAHHGGPSLEIQQAEVAHRHRMEERSIAAEEFRIRSHAAAVSRGQWFAFLSVVVVTLGAVAAAIYGNGYSASAIAGGGGLGLGLLIRRKQHPPE
jgi:uncharacterized membrane protein